MNPASPSAARDRAVNEFKQRFGAAPAHLVRSPGRVNLIGEHTDYNDGFVLPLAIEGATWIALRPRKDATVSLYSTDFQQAAQFNFPNTNQAAPDWADYAKGVAALLGRDGFKLVGFDAVVATDVPVGAGLSSSASFSLAIARSFQSVSGFAWEFAKMARLCQRVEIECVGVNCGIMDQLVIAGAIDGQALLIDCRSLETKPAPLPKGSAVVILDTRKSRTLAGSAYNERRAQCEAAAQFFGVKSLRDLPLPRLLSAEGKPTPLIWRRAKHVVTENDRTQQAAVALAAGDVKKLGELMNASHESLRADYEVSCTELDVITALARQQPGCYGARMTGAGFGGCAVALVEESKVAGLLAAVPPAYEKQFGVKPSLYVTKATAGATEVKG